MKIGYYYGKMKSCVFSKLGVFLIFLLVYLIVNLLFGTQIIPSADNSGLWFYSGLFMLYFSILFIEPYYTSPKNVISNVLPILLLLLPIKQSFEYPALWWLLLVFCGLILFISLSGMYLDDTTKSPNVWQNKLSQQIVKIVNILGRARVLYSLCFLVFLCLFGELSILQQLAMFVLWFIIISLDPSKLHNQLFSQELQKQEQQIGTIFGVQSRKVFLVKLFEDRKGIKKFDVVQFKYKMAEQSERTFIGIVFDTYLLNQEKWAKILALKSKNIEKNALIDNVVYLSTESTTDLNLENFVGIVDSGSDIGKLKFEYSKQNDDLQEGDLLFVEIGKRKIYYQVLNGLVTIESLEARNEIGYIEGEAIQVGEWNPSTLSFQKYGWVPPVNTPVFRTSPHKNSQTFEYPELQLGNVPGTTFPAVINIKDMISHHIAILGVTGSGKTFISHKLIKETIKENKVICIDFTGEYSSKLKNLNPLKIIQKPSGLKDREKEFHTIIGKEEQRKFRENISVILQEYVNKFMADSNPLGILELPDLSNTSFLLEFTQLFIDMVFTYAKERYQQNEPIKPILIVFEEAHTLIPETTSLGDLGDYGVNKALVNKIGQIALQGRKYGVGFMIIAQRTANVSKTVLTQCNTVICFQAFDETSFTFLGNYLGRDLSRTLPHLKQYHAILAGKAMKSAVPMIVDLTQK